MNYVTTRTVIPATPGWTALSLCNAGEDTAELCREPVVGWLVETTGDANDSNSKPWVTVSPLVPTYSELLLDAGAVESPDGKVFVGGCDQGCDAEGWFRQEQARAVAKREERARS